MSELTVIYWRDIPAQVRVGRGRRAARAILPERFEQAIDRVAMKIGATDGRSFQQMAGSMTGMSEDEYREMMVNGGRNPDGNRYTHEWDESNGGAS